jgi:hypothetical protein
VKSFESQSPAGGASVACQKVVLLDREREPEARFSLHVHKKIGRMSSGFARPESIGSVGLARSGSRSSRAGGISSPGRGPGGAGGGWRVAAQPFEYDPDLLFGRELPSPSATDIANCCFRGLLVLLRDETLLGVRVLRIPLDVS